MSYYQFAAFGYHTVSQKLVLPDRKEELLRPKVGLLLETLLISYPEKCSRAELIDKIWQGNYAVGDKGLNQAIWSLRKTLQDHDDQEIIKTWPGQGYAIMVDVGQPENSNSISVAGPYRIKILTALLLLICMASLIYWQSHHESGVEYHLSAFVSGQGRQFNLTQSRQGWMTWLQESEKDTQLVLAKTAAQKQIRWQAHNIAAQAISPDGQYIAFIQQDTQSCWVLLMPSETAASPQTLSDCDISEWPSLSWEESGKTLLFSRLSAGRSGIARYHVGLQQVEQLFADVPANGLFGTFKPQSDKSLTALTYIEHDKTSRYALTSWHSGKKNALYVSDTPFDYCWDSHLQAFVVNRLQENGASLQWLDEQGNPLREMAVPQRVERVDCSTQIYLTLQRKHFGIKTVDPVTGQYQDAIKMFDDSGYFHFQPGTEFPLVVTLKGRTPQISRVSADFKTQVLMNNQNWINIAYPVLSPDSKKIAFQAFSHAGQASLYIFDIERQLTRDLELPTENFAAPQWTEDGEALLVSLQEDNRWHLYQIDIASGDRKIIQEDSLYGIFIQKQLHFSSVADPGLWRQSAIGPEKLLTMPGDAWASWTIDKQQIYSLEYGADNYELYRTALNTDEKQLIARLPKNDYVKWSRLSFWQGQLLFTGLLSNDSDIYQLQRKTTNAP